MPTLQKPSKTGLVRGAGAAPSDATDASRLAGFAILVGIFGGAWFAYGRAVPPSKPPPARREAPGAYASSRTARRVRCDRLLAAYEAALLERQVPVGDVFALKRRTLGVSDETPTKRASSPSRGPRAATAAAALARLRSWEDRVDAVADFAARRDDWPPIDAALRGVARRGRVERVKIVRTTLQDRENGPSRS